MKSKGRLGSASCIVRIMCVLFLATLVVLPKFTQGSVGSTTNTTICDTISNPDKFNNKIVRIRSAVKSDGIERTVLVDESCKQGGVSLWVPQKIMRDSTVAELQDAIYRRGRPGTIGKEISGIFVGRFRWRPHDAPPTRTLVLMSVSDLKVDIKATQ